MYYYKPGSGSEVPGPPRPIRPANLDRPQAMG